MFQLYDPVEVPSIIGMIKNNNMDIKLEGTQKARSHLSEEQLAAPIDDYIEQGILPPLINNLKINK